MAYELKTWVTGEVITADDLNQITPFVEPLIIDGDSGETTHTAEFIFNAWTNGRPCVLYIDFGDGTGGSYFYGVNISHDNSGYRMKVAGLSGTSLGVVDYVAASGTDKFTVEK